MLTAQPTNLNSASEAGEAWLCAAFRGAAWLPVEARLRLGVGVAC